MIPQSQPPESLAEVVRLAVAPVFLLTGIFSFLGVLSQRIVRLFDQLLKSTSEHVPTETSESIISLQKRRFLLINRAFVFATTAAALVCFVVMTLFVSVVSPLNISFLVIPAFVFAMLSLLAALWNFYSELKIGIRIANLRVPGGIIN
jgi:hypothetical protein